MIFHCTQCGAPVTLTIPAGDNLPRHVCTHCAHIHYENPRLIVGCVAEWQGRILLCRRAIAPRIGYWTLPAGFMENGETTAQAAVRETHEEAGAEVAIAAAFAIVNLASFNQIHLFYRGMMTQADFAAGEESLEVRLFAAEDIPWEELAFRSIRFCLEKYLDDRSRGVFGFHEQELDGSPPAA